MKILLHRKDSIQILHYYPLKDKKIFSKKNKILGENECNSGLSYLSYPGEKYKNGDIYIFRQEEFYKVLIHELLHSNYTDEIVVDDNILNTKVCSHYPILMHEIYVETMATMIHMFYIYGIHHSAHHSAHKKGSYSIHQYFELEKRYSIYIRQKIFDHYNIHSIEELIKNEDSSCKKYFPQETNVFSYYIFKPILLCSLEEFGVWMKRNTKYCTIQNETAFYDFLMERILLKLPKINGKLFEKKYNIPKNTLRMTYWG